MLNNLLFKTLVLVSLSTAAFAQTQLSIQTSEPAWVTVDQQRRGLTSAGTPLQVTVAAGKHTVAAEALIGTGSQELNVDAAANATTYVQIKLAGPGAPSPFGMTVRPTPVATPEQDPLRQQQKDLERQQRDAQIRQLEQDITNLEKQMAQVQGQKDQADQAKQDCQNQQQNAPGFLQLLKGTNCMLGTMNSNNAQQQLRQLQVQIASKQRELQRLDRQNSPY